MGVERGNVTKRDEIKQEGCLKTAEEMERGGMPSSAEIGESNDKRETRDPPRRKGGGEQEVGNVEFWTLKENRKRRGTNEHGCVKIKCYLRRGGGWRRGGRGLTCN